LPRLGDLNVARIVAMGAATPSHIRNRASSRFAVAIGGVSSILSYSDHLRWNRLVSFFMDLVSLIQLNLTGILRFFSIFRYLFQFWNLL